MEMHQLRYLEAVAKCGSIMAASASCHVTQPALSVQLKKLEDELGVKLLVRSARGVVLTPAGERALVTARRVLRDVAGLRADAKARSFSNSSTLRVSIQPYVATEILPRVLTDMEEDAMAKGRLEFRERTPARLVESVSNGGSDLGVLDTSSVPVGELCMEEFARVPYALFCHKDHPLTQRSRIKLAHLPAHPVILFDYCPSLRQRLGSLAAERGLELRIPFSTELAVTAFEMLAEGIGISVLPLSFQARASRRQLVTRAIEDYEEVAKVGAVWRDGCELSPQAHSFIERFRLKLRSRKD